MSAIDMVRTLIDYHILVNHGTDHRATILQRPQECDAPTFDQDFILWLWEKAA